jgi:hypothetical protein
MADKGIDQAWVLNEVERPSKLSESERLTASRIEGSKYF